MQARGALRKLPVVDLRLVIDAAKSQQGRSTVWIRDMVLISDRLAGGAARPCRGTGRVLWWATGRPSDRTFRDAEALGQRYVSCTRLGRTAEVRAAGAAPTSPSCGNTPRSGKSRKRPGMPLLEPTPSFWRSSWCRWASAQA